MPIFFIKRKCTPAQVAGVLFSLEAMSQCGFLSAIRLPLERWAKVVYFSRESCRSPHRDTCDRFLLKISIRQPGAASFYKAKIPARRMKEADRRFFWRKYICFVRQLVPLYFMAACWFGIGQVFARGKTVGEVMTCAKVMPRCACRRIEKRPWYKAPVCCSNSDIYPYIYMYTQIKFAVNRSARR